MWGKCSCGTALKSSADILLQKCRRCQTATIGSCIAIIGSCNATISDKPYQPKPMKLTKLTQAMLEMDKNG